MIVITISVDGEQKVIVGEIVITMNRNSTVKVYGRRNKGKRLRM